VLARTDRGNEIQREVHDVAQFFIPIFFVVVGAAVDLRSINPFDPAARGFFWIGLGLTVVGIIGKVAAGFVVRKKGLSRIVIGVGMIPRGEVGLIFAQIGLASKLISGGLYSAVALMVMMTTFITPPLLRRLLVQRTPSTLGGFADYVMNAPMDRPDEDEDGDRGDAGDATSGAETT
jgi:Kef-type K+ transport system membrane component KefB